MSEDGIVTDDGGKSGLGLDEAAPSLDRDKLDGEFAVPESAVVEVRPFSDKELDETVTCKRVVAIEALEVNGSDEVVLERNGL
jgi:hypothetical protein